MNVNINSKTREITVLEKTDVKDLITFLNNFIDDLEQWTVISNKEEEKFIPQSYTYDITYPESLSETGWPINTISL